MKMLDAFADEPNVIQSIGEEYTGPYHFTKFWLQTVAEWEAKTGKHVWVALSCNKDVQDAILQDPELRKVVDIIHIEQWYYTQKGLYAPEGGKNLAPRQYQRRLRPGKVTYDDVFKSVSEYRQAYPEKVVIYSGAFGTREWQGGDGCRRLLSECEVICNKSREDEKNDNNRICKKSFIGFRLSGAGTRFSYRRIGCQLWEAGIFSKTRKCIFLPK